MIKRRKKSQKIVKKEDTKSPRFIGGLVVREPSLIVDEYGRMWWVDTNTKTVTVAKVT